MTKPHFLAATGIPAASSLHFSHLARAAITFAGLTALSGCSDSDAPNPGSVANPPITATQAICPGANCTEEISNAGGASMGVSSPVPPDTV